MDTTSAPDGGQTAPPSTATPPGMLAGVSLEQGFNQLIGLSFDVVSGDEVVVHLPIEPFLHQPYGIVHGGVWCTMVETAASIGAAAWFGDRGSVVGVANHTNFLRAAREGVVTGTATPIHRGRLQQLWMVEITDADGRLLARGEVRLQNLASADSLGRS
jgi:1,4-dihydroxy-2-naphthoyl-CoA hydrolase